MLFDMRLCCVTEIVYNGHHPSLRPYLTSTSIKHLTVTLFFGVRSGIQQQKISTLDPVIRTPKMDGMNMHKTMKPVR